MANKVVITGQVVQEPFLSENTTGNWLLKILVEEVHKWTKSHGAQKRAAMQKNVRHSLVLWGPMAQTTAEEVKKGDMILVDGMLEYHEFKDPKRGGEMTRTAQINVRQIEVLHKSEDPS